MIEALMTTKAAVSLPFLVDFLLAAIYPPFIYWLFDFAQAYDNWFTMSDPATGGGVEWWVCQDSNLGPRHYQ